MLVIYVQQDTATHNPVHAGGAGYVSLFDTQGPFVRRIASQGNLNAPWAATIAPSTFGMFQGAPAQRKFRRRYHQRIRLQLRPIARSTAGRPRQRHHQHFVVGTAIRRERAGNPNTLDIPAGLNNEHHGLFAAITAINTQQPATAVFSRSANPTISAGQPATFMLSVTALEGFNCAVTFSCSGEPANFPYRHTQRRERRHRVWARSAW